MRKTFILFVIFSFFANLVLPPMGWAQEIVLPKPGSRITLSPPFNPLMLKGIKVHPENPLLLEFILDQGDEKTDGGQSGTNRLLKERTGQLIKYFLASLTVPENDLWVNLSPYEKNHIVPDSFGLTEMGRDLLAEDYMLKQITASLIYPEGETGKKFWKRVYQEAEKKFGTPNIPVNTFNKVWIVPQKATVYENTKAGAAYVVESKLKVMLEQDYLSLSHHVTVSQEGRQNTSLFGSQIVREIVIPVLTKEINEGKNFAQLRQAYNALILATWYKRKIKDSILNTAYSDHNKVAGVNINDPKEKQKIYKRYLQAFKKGAYNYIKEEQDPVTRQIVPKKYFSGGIKYKLGRAMLQVTHNDAAMTRRELGKNTFRALVWLGIQSLGHVPTAIAQTNSPQPFTPNAVATFFQARTNPATGLVRSFFEAQGTVPTDIVKYGTDTYDISQWLMKADPVTARTIIKTYLKQINQAYVDNPSTENYQYVPLYGIYEIIRSEGIDIPFWWNTWDFGVNIGASAKIATSMLYRMKEFPDLIPQILQYCVGRANHILAHQDTDGGFRYGPQGQYYATANIEALTRSIKGRQVYEMLRKKGILSHDSKGKVRFNFPIERMEPRLAEHHTPEKRKLWAKDYLGKYLARAVNTEEMDIMAAVVDLHFYWDIKSTEKNETALLFLDNLIYVLSNLPPNSVQAQQTLLDQYQAAAQKNYDWLMNIQYVPVENRFLRGARDLQETGQWVADTEYSPDTINWAPLPRMLNDVRLGASPFDRLVKIDLMMQEAKNRTGVYQLDSNGNQVLDGNNNPVLLGLSYTDISLARNVISPEFTMQYAIRASRLATELAALPYDQLDPDSQAWVTMKIAEYQNTFQNLMAVVQGYFTQQPDGSYVAPYAVYPPNPDGTVTAAVNEDTGNGYFTPNAFASLISSIYLFFGLIGFDPVEPFSVTAARQANQAMIINRMKRRNVIFSPNSPGGIDFNVDQLDVALKNSGGEIKFKTDSAMLSKLQNAYGIVPHVTEIQKMKDLKGFFGLGKGQG